MPHDKARRKRKQEERAKKFIGLPQKIANVPNKGSPAAARRAFSREEQRAGTPKKRT